MRFTATLVSLTLLATAGMASAQVADNQSKTAQSDSDNLQTIQQRLDKVETTLEVLKKENQADEAAQKATASDVKKINKIKFSGYTQIRYNQDQSSTLTKNNNTFDVRRARLKMMARPTEHVGVTYEADFGGVLGSSGGGNVSTRNAFIDYYFKGDPATGWTATAGQMLWPYGYQNTLSSSLRETPEYALPISSLLPGQYDRGVKIASPSKYRLTFESGVYNGIQNGGTAPVNKNDDNFYKDVVGRTRYHFASNLEGGVSWYVGKSQKPVVGQPKLSRDLYGADMEYYFHNGTLKAEYLGGVADGFNKSGYWAQITHDFTPKDMAVVMYDIYSDPTNVSSVNSSIHVGNENDWYIGYIRQLDKSTRFKLFYTVKGEEINSYNNNLFTAELLTIF